MSADGIDGEVAQFGDHRIERLLGRGGMAAVYEAWDAKHGRSVALKVFSSEASSQADRERFLREVRVAARLQHPHLCPVHDSGETEGRLWFTMPLVGGESLRARLQREPRPPLAFVRRVVRKAAQGLHAAHRAAVVHRDVKPENLLLTTDETTLVADFGIARPSEASADGVPPADATLTATGFLVGTPAYMSPEQLDGRRDAGPAADQYALALVAYESLAGRHPFAGADGRAPGFLRSAAMPPALETLRPDVGAVVGHVLQRALAPNPADRFPSITHFADAFDAALGSAPATGHAVAASPADARGTPSRGVRRAVAAVAAVVLLAGGYGAWSWLAAAMDGGPSRIAVLPFEDVGVAQLEAFADGVSDAVRGRLATAAELDVLASTSSASFVRSAAPLDEIARSLGVEYLLTGTVRWTPGDSQVVITPTLVRQVRGRSRTVWTEQIVGAQGAAFALQDSVATRVARAMAATIRGTTDAAVATGTRSLDAYEAFVLAERESQYGAAADPVRLARAELQYQRAVELDPAYGRAWSRLAWARAFRIMTSGGGDSATLSIAEATLDSARRYADDDPSTPLAESILISRTNRERALQVVLAGTRRHPRHAMLHAHAASMFFRTLQMDSARVYILRARQLDPRAPEVLVRAGMIHNALREYAVTDTVMTTGIELAPGNFTLHAHRIEAALGAGDVERARDRLRAALADVAGGERSILIDYTGRNHIGWILRPDQQALLLQVDSGPGRKNAPWTARAQLHALLGDSTAARREASRVVEQLPSRGLGDVDNAMARAVLGDCAPAMQLQRTRIDIAPERIEHLTYFQLLVSTANAFTWCGDHEAAIALLDRLLRLPNRYSARWLALDPQFAPLRTHPRFRALGGLDGVPGGRQRRATGSRRTIGDGFPSRSSIAT